MSGHKRTLVRLNRQDVTRMESLNDRLRQVEDDYQDIRQTLFKERKQNMQEFTHALESRQKEFQDILESYNQDVVYLENRTGEVLREQADVLTRRMEDQNSTILDQAEIYVQEHLQEMNSILDQNNMAVWEHFNTLRNDLSQIYSANECKHFLAEQAIQTAAGLAQSIEEVYDHNRYFPGFLENINYEIDSSVKNLNSGFSEAALVQAQQICQQTSNMRLELEEILQQTSLSKTFVIEKIHQLCLVIDKNAFVHAINLEGEELDVVIDVDFWTSSAYSRLKSRCDGLAKQLEDDNHCLSKEEYERITEFILPQLENSIQDLVADARIKVILSQIRYNIAETVLGKLEEQGFEVQNASYQELDERFPYELIVQNLEGSQLKVFIASGDEPGNYSLEIETREPEQYSDKELRSRANMILNSLRSAGLQVGSPVEVQPPNSDPINFDQTVSYKDSTYRLSSAYGD